MVRCSFTGIKHYTQPGLFLTVLLQLTENNSLLTAVELSGSVLEHVCVCRRVCVGVCVCEREKEAERGHYCRYIPVEQLLQHVLIFLCSLVLMLDFILSIIYEGTVHEHRINVITPAGT